MAKKVFGYSFRGYLDFNEGTITEVSKDQEKTFDISAVLKEFHDKQVSFTIKEDIEPDTVDEKEDVDE